MLVVVAAGATVSSGGASAVTTLFTDTANTSGQTATPARSAAVAQVLAGYNANVAAADSTLRALGDLATRRDIAGARRAFVDARRAYKRVEWLAEHYTPLTAAALNGPAIDKPDDESPKIVVHPTGLQTVEAMLYQDTVTDAALDSVAVQARMARVNIKRLRERADETTVTETQLFDAARAEIGRMVSLGISGFDTPLVETAVPEAAAVIESISAAMAAIAPASGENRELQRIGTAAHAFLNATPSFEEFDQFTFITQFANPYARALGALQRAAGVPRLTDARAWAVSSNTLFDSNAFNAQAFSPTGAKASSQERVALGARLFYETRLSGNGDRSCATCHMPSRALADGLRVPAPIHTQSMATSRESADERRVAAPPRNTPTLYNAALQAAAFADARIAFLEDQITTVISNPREMGGDIEHAATVLRGDTSYTTALVAAFGGVPSPLEMSRELRSALAAYLRSLVRLNSRFDQAMRGNLTAMNGEEKRGFNLFMGKAKCGSCHFAPLFNGTVPPGYTDSEVEVLGVPASLRKPQTIDSDLGAGAADRAALHNHAFKTPTVRNAAVTAPYMHNGSIATLEELVDFYDAGGGAGLGMRVNNQTLSPDSLHLDAGEKRALVAFMKALTDTASAPDSRSIASRPASMPAKR